MTTSTTPPAQPAQPSATTVDRTGETPAVHVEGLWKIFGPRADKIMASEDAQLSRKELQEKTGHVIGVRDVSFDVAPGEVFVVMGLSGSGKSTLVRLLTRLIEPTAGTIELYGEDITAMSERDLLETRRRKVSMVFQHFGLLPHRKVVDNIAFGLEVRGEHKGDRRNRAQEMIDLVGLSGYENNFPDQLSGGMQQRVGLARALAVGPRHHDVRRAVLGPRPADPPGHAERGHPAARRGRQDDGVHHPRPRGGAQARRPDPHHARRRDRADRARPTRWSVPPADDYVRDFVSDVPKSHVLTLKWVMRQPNGQELDGPVLQSDQIVRDAARAVLDHHGPCRVVEGDKLVGVVDDQDILRVVVAEDED